MDQSSIIYDGPLHDGPFEGILLNITLTAALTYTLTW